MLGWLSFLLNLGLGLLGLRKKGPMDAERAGQATTALEAERTARHEVSEAIRADREFELDRLRHANGTSTTDPAADINQDDGFRRD